MRRVLIALVAAVVLTLTVAPAAHALAAPATNGAVLAQQHAQSGSSDSSSGGAPSIIPSPNERGKNNFGGLIVGAVLLGGWGLAGYGLYRQAQRRRAAAARAVAEDATTRI